MSPCQVCGGRSKRVDSFLREAAGQMFKAAGLPEFDPEITKLPEWRKVYTWARLTEDEFREWFVKTAEAKLGWSREVAHMEYDFFSMTTAWQA